MANLGTDKVDPVVGFIARTINRSVEIDSDMDGKVEGGEILSYAQNRGFDAFATFAGFTFSEFKAQIKDLDAEERTKEIEIFAKEFDLTNDVAEILLEDWLRYLNNGADLFLRTRKLLSKKASSPKAITKSK